MCSSSIGTEDEEAAFKSADLTRITTALLNSHIAASSSSLNVEGPKINICPSMFLLVDYYL
jgi:hypothetical protein